MSTSEGTTQVSSRLSGSFWNGLFLNVSSVIRSDKIRSGSLLVEPSPEVLRFGEGFEELAETALPRVDHSAEITDALDDERLELINLALLTIELSK